MMRLGKKGQLAIIGVVFGEGINPAFGGK